MLQTDLDWPDPVEVINEKGTSPVVLICEHASNHIPAEYRGLGLSDSDLCDHIAWDMGAADVTKRLSLLIDAPAFLGTYSRLLIDLNRPLGVTSSVPQRGEGKRISGNIDLSVAERSKREQRIFYPFHDRIGTHLDVRQSQRQRTSIVSVHSFTPVYLGTSRPWHAGILYDGARDFGRRLLARLMADTSLLIGENEPYAVSHEDDYALPVHGDNRNIAAVLLEIRQDGLASEHDRQSWAERLADALVAESEAAYSSSRRKGSGQEDARR